MEVITEFKLLIDILLAMILGGIIGAEREMADKPAGFRTQMLVAGSATALVGLMNPLAILFFGEISASAQGVDPVRIIQAIIVGLSFLGAGTIIRRSEKESVEGLTTAASILMSGCIGIAVGVQQYIIATGLTILTLVVLRMAKFIEIILHERKK